MILLFIFCIAAWVTTDHCLALARRGHPLRALCLGLVIAGMGVAILKVYSLMDNISALQKNQTHLPTENHPGTSVKTAALIEQKPPPEPERLKIR